MTSNRRNLIILFLTMVVIMLGFGIIIPILPFYVEAMGASGRDLGLLMAIFALMQLIFAPMWGGLSDRIGRKPVLLIGIVGNALSQLLMGLATQLWMLFAARALAGILSSATLPTAMAYIGDSTSAERRSGGMGVIGAAMGVGMVLGPGLGGWLAAENLSWPFFLAAALSVVVLVFVHLILPESLPPERRTTRRQTFNGPDLGGMWRALTGPLGYLMFLSFLLSFGLTNFEGIFGLYALERFGYGPQQVGSILTIIGLTSAVTQAALTGPLSRRWGESRVIQGALLVSAVGFVLMLSANSFATLLLTTSFFIIGNALLRPVAAALISRRSSEQEQGMALGMHNSFMSLGRIVGPVWAGFAFDYWLSLPYLSGALIMTIGLLTTFVWLTHHPPAETAVAALSE
ncbi:MAG: MFS transporter [Caldilineae bacterium]|nr:MAG: MFS transporter [Caldilineae bacterium]